MQGLTPESVIHLTPNGWTEPFWAATAEHRLILPRCTACATYRFPPTPFCWHCRAQEVEWVEHTGDGTIYSFTVVRHAVIPDVREALPLIAVVVEIPDTDECRVIGNLVDCEPRAVQIGLPVTIDWYDVRDGETVPVFRLAP